MLFSMKCVHTASRVYVMSLSLCVAVEWRRREGEWSESGEDCQEKVCSWHKVTEKSRNPRTKGSCKKRERERERERAECERLFCCRLWYLGCWCWEQCKK